MIGKDATLVRELASGLDRNERLVIALRYTEDLSGVGHHVLTNAGLPGPLANWPRNDEEIVAVDLAK